MLVERILMNLVANAVRYTNAGGVVVGCRPRGSHIRFDVCDSGPGLPDEHRRRLFDGSAQRVSLSSGGLGLGLSIVGRLARLLGHPIEIDTSSGRGSRLSLVLPATEHASVAREDLAQRVQFPDPASGRLIVVIDDDPLALDGMAGVLRSWGCQVVAVHSGERALAMLEREQRRPDLLISDFWLSNGETGIDAISRIREAFGRPIPACLISGDIVSEPLRQASAKGYPMLHKPVTPLRLRAVVHQLIDPESHLDTDRSTRDFPVIPSSRLH
jgi:CheY-like chemotaxis protein